MSFPKFLKDKKVFLTGHTGFKGSWLLQILALSGAKVTGYALAPQPDNDLYHQMNGDKLCHSVIADVRDAKRLEQEILQVEPDIIFHLAAQALVRESYQSPIETFETNVMGTAYVLEAMRHLSKPCVGVMITTDKVYENKETGKAFKESDPLGGFDPYSSSKAAAELVIASYHKSFFPTSEFPRHQKRIVAMRAGNVIGGGDFAKDRIIPDIVRAIDKGVPVQLRNPAAVRPWQHVLEPLSAYISIAEALATRNGDSLLPAYNIGPEQEDVWDVESMTRTFIEAYGNGSFESVHNPNAPHEAGLLMLDNSAIKKDLNWKPKFNAHQAVAKTAEWYADHQRNASVKMQQQIEDYFTN